MIPGPAGSSRPAGSARSAMTSGLMIDLAAAARTLGDGLYSRLVALARTPDRKSTRLNSSH